MEGVRVMAKWGKCDFRQLERMQKQLEKLEKEQTAFCASCAKELAARLMALVKKRTPVDTGELRRNWTAGTVERKGDEIVIEVINGLLYASYVEYGHRTANHKGWVEGKFMLTVSVAEVERMAPKLVERKLQKFLEDLLDAK